MSKSELMIKDIERTAEVMYQFRTYLVHRIDFVDLIIPDDITELALSNDSLRINILTMNMWPSFWILPNAYSSLVLPLGLDIIKSEFIHFFHFHYFSDKKSMEIWDISNDEHKCFHIHGSTENQARINGIFEPTSETCDGWPVYAMRGNSNSILEFSGKTSSWQIKKKSDKGKNTGWAYCKASAMVSPENLDKQWFVWKKAAKKWIPQPIKVSALLNHFSNIESKDISISEDSYRNPADAPRKLLWCHCAGTVTLQAHISGLSSQYLIATEPQAAVLLSFNGDATTHLSYENLKKSLNLNDEYMSETLTSLTTADAPILAYSSENKNLTGGKLSFFSAEDYFSLSPSFLAGVIGGLSMDSPIVLSSIQTDKVQSEAHLVAAGVSSLHGWRNELIDACVVRILKDAFIHKNGIFSNNSYMKNSALPIDTLSYRVRKSLEDRCAVSDEDIMRRRYLHFINYQFEYVIILYISERLVSIGIIDKVVGNIETLRSVAYCYLSENAAILTDTRSSMRLSAVTDKLTNYSKKLTGQDLFDHLRIILGISKLPFNVPGISKNLFSQSFLQWIIQSRCSLDNSQRIHTLDIVANLIIEFLHASIQQLNALKLQYLEGVQSSRNGKEYQSFQLRSIRGLRQLTKNMKALMSNRYNNVEDSSDPCVHRYLGLDRVYLEHLPVEIIHDILSAFRGLAGRPAMEYSMKSFTSVHTELPRCFDSLGMGDSSAKVTSKEEEDRQFLLSEIDAIWSHSALVSKAELLWKYGFDEDWFRDDSVSSLKGNRTVDLYASKSILTDTSGGESPSNLKAFSKVSSSTSSLSSDKLNRKSSSATSIVFPSSIDDKSSQFKSPVSGKEKISKIDEFLKLPTDILPSSFKKDSSGIDTGNSSQSQAQSPPNRWKYHTQSATKNYTDGSKVKLSFQHFLSSLLLTASSNITLTFQPEPATPKVFSSRLSSISSSKEASFDAILDTIFLRQLTDELARILRTDLQYNDEGEYGKSRLGEQSEGDNTESNEVASEDERGENEVMIPCEFCTDCFRVSQFESHALLCQTGRAHLTTTLPRDESSPPRIRSSKKNKNVSQLRNTPGKQRPNSFSAISLSFVQSLLNSVAKSAADEYCEFDFDHSWDERDRGGSSAASYYEPNFSALIDHAFSVLDTDGDGYLTASDFSAMEISYSELEATVDPFQLYKTSVPDPSRFWAVGQLSSSSFDLTIQSRSAELKSEKSRLHKSYYIAGVYLLFICFLFPSFTPKVTEKDTIDEEFSEADKDSDKDSSSLETPIPFQKSNSLWMSVSTEKSLPVVDASRSISGLDEAEIELCSLIDRARHILDDSEAATVALLIYYKWYAFFSLLTSFQ